MSRNTIGRLFAGALMIGGLLFGPAALRANAQVLEWVLQPGGTIAEPEFSRGVSADGLGNVYVAGSGGVGPSITDTGIADAFLSKYDAAGNHQWTQRIETEELEAAYGVSADGLGNVYISGRTMGGLGDPRADAFLNKYNAEGVLQWARQFGTDDNDVSLGVSADGIGNVYVVGETFGFRSHDASIRKYDAEGILQWTREQLGRANRVSADGLGNAFVVGFAYLKKYDAAGNLAWTQQFGNESAQAVSADALGNIFVSQRISLGGDNYSGVLSKFDTVGGLQWTKEFQSGNFFNFAGVSGDGLGNVYVSSEISAGAGSRDVYVSKYDAEGVLQWTRLLETNQIELNGGVSADGLGNVYISGSVQVRPFYCCPLDPGDSDPFLAKYNDCPDCVPPPIPPIVIDTDLGGEIFPGSLVSHQFMTSFGDLPVTWSNLVSTRPTVNPPTLLDTGLFSWETTKLDEPGIYYFDVTATNDGGSDVGRLTVRLTIVPEPSTLMLLSLGIFSSLIVLRARG